MLFWILKITALTKAVSRAREAVKFGLEDIYKKKTRPKSLSNSEYFYVAALVDSTSIPICRPTGKHLEVKPYWDHKHSMYALKKQVVVMAQKPHLALFSTEYSVGSKFDFKIFRESYKDFQNYFKKTDREKVELIGDESQSHWSICGDKAYVGKAQLTPPIRRVTPKKKPTTPSEIQRNGVISRIRCPVEQFFGRLTKIWFITGEYRYSHEHFDTDMDNCIFLTNLHIEMFSSLDDQDGDYYRRLIAAQRKKKEEISLKRKKQRDAYLKRKRQMLQREDSEEFQYSDTETDS